MAHEPITREVVLAAALDVVLGVVILGAPFRAGDGRVWRSSVSRLVRLPSIAPWPRRGVLDRRAAKVNAAFKDGRAISAGQKWRAACSGSWERRNNNFRGHQSPRRDRTEGAEMTDGFDDQKWIREIAMHSGRKYTADNIDRTSYQRLADFGWLTPFVINASDVEYVATDQGKAAVKSG
jgi:hypothetical protein